MHVYITGRPEGRGISITNRKLRIVGYIRVSTVEQARQGESLTTQRQRIKRYLELADAELVDVIADDGKSGKSLDREGFQKVLRRLRNDEVDGICLLQGVKALCLRCRDVVDKSPRSPAASARQDGVGVIGGGVGGLDWDVPARRR